ncbi:MAG: hypothetical protein ABEN55_01600, partial [Bradymonadaceae bacterium]
MTQSITIRKIESFAVDASVEPVFERLQRGAAVDGTIRAGGEPVEGVRVTATIVPVSGTSARDDAS